jgi:hypothetical protein
MSQYYTRIPNCHMILYVHREDGGSIFLRNVGNKLPQSPKSEYLNTDLLSRETVESYARLELKMYLHFVLIHISSLKLKYIQDNVVLFKCSFLFLLLVSFLSQVLKCTLLECKKVRKKKTASNGEM